MKFKCRFGVLFLLTVSLLCCPASAAFADVAPESWYAQAVEETERLDLLSGYPDGSFRPEASISAAEFVTIAARCTGLSPAQGQTDYWAAGYLQAALQAGWYDWDELPPTGERFDRPIPRQLAVKILMRALLPRERGDYNTESAKIRDFSQLDGRYYEPVLAAYAAGIVSGDGMGRFNPLNGLSRAEACAIFSRALKRAGGTSAPPPIQPQPDSPAGPAAQGGVSENGWLQVVGTQLCNQAGEPVVLRGMSTHGMQWYGQYANSQSIRGTAQYGANLFRVAMYTGEGGYLSDPDALRQQVTDAVDAAIASDMYVIIDWHILSDGNPMSHLTQARSFFADMAARYREEPAVLYEICNEPNGNVTWERDIRPYAEQIVETIRSRSPQAVILVGSGTWSQDIHLAARSPLEGENLMYTLHFYAGTHGEELRRRIDDALKAGLPIFVSEWGASRADGSGGVFLKEAGQWLDFLAERRISWANWSLCDKNETSAALRPGTAPDGAWEQEDLSESGRFVFSRFSG